MLLISFPAGSHNTSQFVVSNQICRASSASCDHLLMAFSLHPGLGETGWYVGVNKNRLWSDFPSSGRAGEVPATFLKSSVLLSLVTLLTNWWNFGNVVTHDENPQ